MTAPTYELTTLADLLLVPADRREACVRELLYALLTAELAFDDKAHALIRMPYRWTDDDLGNVTITDANGEPFLTLEVTKERAHG